MPAVVESFSEFKKLLPQTAEALSSYSIYDIPTYASSVTGGTRQHLLALALVLQLGRDIP